MFTKLSSATTIGIHAHLVDVEVDLALGMLQFNIVGLPDTAIKESRQRVATALKNCGIKLPERKITVNLAPADIEKKGTLFDLPIALGILYAAQLIEIDPQWLQETLFLGELSLDGNIKTVKGVLPIACDAHALGKKRLIVPQANAKEAALISSLEVYGFENLVSLIAFLKKELPAQKVEQKLLTSTHTNALDFVDVKGQFQAKRALQIAAAGRHNVLFVGSPGSGKTMLAQRLPTIMPEMAFEEVLETSKIYSVSGKQGAQSFITQRPFRAPHHTISAAGLVGGGSHPQPGEISLAHNGILFLDELTEFKRSTLEVMRQPLEEKQVTISRANQTVSFPASFTLIAALNPCPCGYYGDKKNSCVCTQQQIGRYLEKLSGPLLDRIDLQIKIPSLDYATVSSSVPSQSSQELYAKVACAVKKQKERFGSTLISNAHMTPHHIALYCALNESCKEYVKKIFDNLHMSMRGYHKMIKVARTIADLENSENIELQHLQEACMYRSVDRLLDKK